MNLKITKKPIMGIAAILILIFHFFPISWQKDSISNITRFITLTSYIGVDIFLFTTGYMLYYSDTSNYFKYIKRKITKLYIIFLVFSLINLFIKKMNIQLFFKTILGIDLFINGGSSFLWFIPSIIIFYLFAPFLIRFIKNKNGKTKYLYIMFLWLILVFLLELIFKNNSINIFLCRIPIMIVGIYLAEYGVKKDKNYIMTFLLVIGFVLIYRYGYINKINYPIENIFYVISIPYILGIIFLLDTILNKFKSNVLTFIGNNTLELYSLQMLIGQIVFEKVFKLIEDKYISFLIVSLVLIFLSYVLNLLITKVLKKK